MDILKKYEQWNWERLRRHLLYWLLWSTFFVTVNSWANPENLVWQWIAFEAVVLPVKILCTYIIAYLLMPRLLYKKQYLRFFVVVALVALFFAALLYLEYVYIILPTLLESTKSLTIDEFIYKGVELVYIASLVMGIKFFQNYLHEQKRNQILNQQKVEAELKYLKNQIQPHFLFNTLNNIYGMVLSKDIHAGEAIVKLSSLLSYMLYEGETSTVMLHKEVEMLDSFVELELLRYRRKLDFKYTKHEFEPDLKIAPLLLIPFVENAFKHGPAKEEGRSFIHINLEVQQGVLYFSVQNSYSSSNNLSNVQSGIGLQNIQKRLELLYPNQHTLTIQEDDIFEVRLMLELSNG